MTRPRDPASDFLRLIAAARPDSEGRILLGVQYRSGGLSLQPYDGGKVPDDVTHINSALYRPDGHGNWGEGGHLVTHTLALVLDDQGDDDKTTIAPDVVPTARLETSPGREQWVYVYDDLIAPERGQGMAHAAATAGMSDTFIANRTHHWWRIPGRVPPPKIAEGKTTPARLIEWTGEVFGYDDLAARLGIEPTPAGPIYSGSRGFDEVSASRDPVLQWLDANDHTDGRGFDGRGFVNVTCPNAKRHSNGSPWARYVPPNDASDVGFTCHHDHCNGYRGERVGLKEFRAWIAEQGGPSVLHSRTHARGLRWGRQTSALAEAMKRRLKT